MNAGTLTVTIGANTKGLTTALAQSKLALAKFSYEMKNARNFYFTFSHLSSWEGNPKKKVLKMIC